MTGWEGVAGEWVEHVRGGRDAPYAWNLPAFLELLPPPARLTVDIGCGEGRVDRELQRLGHRVVATDASPSLVERAREADPDGDYRVAEAAALPFADEEADLVVAFMSLHDIADLDGAVRDAARVLGSGGRFCFAIVHPVASAGDFQQGSDELFEIAGSYLAAHEVPRQLGDVAVTQFHRPLDGYFRALEAVGFLSERVRELPSGAARLGGSRRSSTFAR